MPLKWIPRSKSGASKSRPRWAAHTRIGNVWEYPPPGGEGEGCAHTCVTCMTFCGDLKPDNDRAKTGAHENGCFAHFFEIRSAFVRWATRSSLWKSSEKTWTFSDIINLCTLVSPSRYKPSQAILFTPLFTASLNATCSVFTFVLFQAWLMKHRN